MDMDQQCLASVPQKDTTEVTRPIADFHPDLWGDFFPNDTPFDEDAKNQLEQEVKQLKEEVRERILGKTNDPKQKLALIDDIERLGVAYHFEEEIEAYLQKFYEDCEDDNSYQNDLSYVSLRFRLLRQHGFYVSPDVFKKLKHENGSFKDTQINDVEGILNLYEASHLRINGEDILDQAVTFTTDHLRSLAIQLNSNMSERVNRALKRPLHWCCARLESKYNISVYESHPLHDETLLRFAKVDFNLLQLLHKKELTDLYRWSRNLGFTTKLPYFRDRMAESYYWILGAYHEPQYSFARMIFNKLIKIVTLIDDIYDAYGTIEELKLFTNAILRWDKGCMSNLPECMKFAYQVTLDTVQEIEQELAKEERSYGAYYMQQEIKAISQGYIQEAKWCHEGYVPTYEEYMISGVETGGFFYMITASYLGMGAIATKDAFEWVRGNSKTPKASSTLGRLINDLASHKFEQTRGHVASAVEIHMAQYDMTLEEARVEILRKMEQLWKDINEEMLRPTKIPMPLLARVLNLCRVLYAVYQIDKDGFTMAQLLQDEIQAILIDPVKL